MGRKDGEKSAIKLYSSPRKTLINKGFSGFRVPFCFSDFESRMKNVILGNLMCFSSILVKVPALAKVPIPANEIPETPCLQGFSPLFDFVVIFAEKGEFGEKTHDSNPNSYVVFGPFLQPVFPYLFPISVFLSLLRYLRRCRSSGRRSLRG